jgi:hypothetical protein
MIYTDKNRYKTLPVMLARQKKGDYKNRRNLLIICENTRSSVAKLRFPGLILVRPSNDSVGIINPDRF